MIKTYELEQSPLYRMRNRRKLAIYLGLPADYFNKEKDYHYTEFSKPKPNGKGTRHYCVPEEKLKKIQKKICVLISRMNTPEWLISGKKKMSYIVNAEKHLDYKFVKTLDITDFYNSTQKKYVFEFFKETLKMDRDIAWLMTDLVMHKGVLPTGSPSSQVVVYWAYKDMFSNIFDLAQKYECKFTLYVDDMTFSSNKPISNKLRDEVERILNSYGLHAKTKKDHYYQTNNTKIITGVGIKNGSLIVVNRRRKSIIDQYKNCKKTDDIEEIERLQGMLNSVRQIEPNIFPEIANYLRHNNQRLLEYKRERSKNSTSEVIQHKEQNSVQS